MTSIAAIVLAGGRGSRLGGVDKAALLLDGETLLVRALAALHPLTVVVVGPQRQLRSDVLVVREQPPLGGPAAAAITGLSALPPAVLEVLLLAVDVPALPRVVPLLLAASAGRDGVLAVDGQGREQWLLGRYRVGALRSAAERLGNPAGRPLRDLLGRLALSALALPPEYADDVDTVADAERAGVTLPAAR